MLKEIIRSRVVLAAFMIISSSAAAAAQVTIGAQPAASGGNTQSVRVTNTGAEPVPVKIIPMSNGRKAFQARAIVSPTGTGNQSVSLPIPAGKRLIIENVSVISRIPAGMRAETNFNTYIDNNNDGIGDIADITFHRVALIDQGTFDATQIATANHDVLVFADEQIGAAHYVIGVTARLNGMPPSGFVSQVQYTFSGWVEDIPTP